MLFDLHRDVLSVVLSHFSIVYISRLLRTSVTAAKRCYECKEVIDEKRKQLWWFYNVLVCDDLVDREHQYSHLSQHIDMLAPAERDLALKLLLNEYGYGTAKREMYRMVCLSRSSEHFRRTLPTYLEPLQEVFAQALMKHVHPKGKSRYFGIPVCTSPIIFSEEYYGVLWGKFKQKSGRFHTRFTNERYTYKTRYDLEQRDVFVTWAHIDCWVLWLRADVAKRWKQLSIEEVKIAILETLMEETGRAMQGCPVTEREEDCGYDSD